MQIDLEGLMRLTKSDDALVCPHCGHAHDLSDCEVTQQVTSYWGEDLHNYSCSDCGKDFVVQEIVTRKYETAKTADDLEI
jgi:DNA-directed RNA polymerase subunit RPC12/RpoP